MDKQEKLLELKNVVFSFRTYAGVVQSVRDVSFDVRKGEILGIVGESGCGKSVTVQSILRLNPEPPGFFGGGEIIYKGQNLLELREKFGTSIIMITHDLGVIAKLCDRVVVMYGGKVVEQGTVEEIFYETSHPYTKGLMNSIARLDMSREDTLTPIEGTPPDLFAPPKGCPFAARCEYAMDVCYEYPPERSVLSEEHVASCWLHHEFAPKVDLRTGGRKHDE